MTGRGRMAEETRRRRRVGELTLLGTSKTRSTPVLQTIKAQETEAMPLRKGAMHITGLTLSVLALCGVCLVSCAVSPPRPASQYRVPPQGPHEQAVAQAFEALVRAYGRQDWGDVMALIADDAQIEPAAPDVVGPSGADAPRVRNKREFGEAIKPMIASLRGYQVEDVQLMTVSPTEVRVRGTVTLLTAGRPSVNRERLWVFENRGERWLVVRAQFL
jgi:hypothetical protein